MGLSFSTLTRKQMGFIRSLHHKKYRRLHRSFIVEGKKSVMAFLAAGFEPVHILATSRFVEGHGLWAKEYEGLLVLVPADRLGQLGAFKENRDVLLVARQRREVTLPLGFKRLLLLDGIQDPGNLGTMIRVAAWYGLDGIVCSPVTVDCYNLKVVQASMGALATMPVLYEPLVPFIEKMKGVGVPIIGAVLSGADISYEKLPERACLLMGNEAHGIASELFPHLTNRVTIPSYGAMESLNVAVATAVLCDRWLAGEVVASGLDG